MQERAISERMGSSAYVVVGIVVVAFFCSSCVTASAQQQVSACSTTFKLQNGTEKTYTLCQNLQVQNATLAWNYFPGDNVTGGILDVAFTDTLLSAGGWVGWGLNPVSSDPQMVGSSVLVAFTDASAGSVVLPYFLGSKLLNANPPALVSGKTDLNVIDSSVKIDGTSLQTTIFATVQLKPGQTNVIQVWNKGPSVTGRSPNSHNQVSSTYLNSFGSLDVVNGTVISAGGTPQLQNVHGILNAVSWGVLFPVGILAARYMKPFAIFDPIWFYLHVACQVCGYILGVAGFATGLKILDSKDVKYLHRNLGIALFVFATVQIAALLLRPGPKHKLRKFWNVYHWTFGYTIVILSIINIFQGFHLLQPATGYKRAYIGVIAGIGGLALLLEVITWILWLSLKFKERYGSTTGTNGTASNGKIEKYSYAP